MFDYEISVDTDRRGNFSSGLGDISAYVIDCNWGYGLNSAWEQVASSAYLRLTLNNADGRFSLTDSSALYYGKMTHGTLVRVRVSYDGVSTTMAVLKIKDFRYLPDASESGNGAEHRLQLVCEDPVRNFLSLDFVPSLRFDVSIDDSLYEIFQQQTFFYPYDGAYFFVGFSEIGGDDVLYDYLQEDLIDFEESYATLPFSGDNLDRGQGSKVQAYIRDLMKPEFTGFFFWDIRAEKFRFFNRYHAQIVQRSPFVGREISYVFDMRDISAVRSAYAEDLANEVSVHYYPRTVGSAGSVIASSGSVPITLSPGSDRTFRLRYRDEDVPSAKIAAKDVIDPVLGFDIVANSEPDGSGFDRNPYIDIGDVSLGAEQTELNISNWHDELTVHITQLQVRGTPITTYDKETVTLKDGDSRRLYDRAVMSPENCRLIADPETATDYANHLLNLRKTPDLFFKSITLTAKDADIIEQIQNRVVGDTITVIDARGVSTNYMIVGEKHQAQIAEGKHEVEWVLRPIKYGNIFIVGSSEIGGGDLLLGV